MPSCGGTRKTQCRGTLPCTVLVFPALLERSGSQRVCAALVAQPVSLPSKLATSSSRLCLLAARHRRFTAPFCFTLTLCVSSRPLEPLPCSFSILPLLLQAFTAALLFVVSGLPPPSSLSRTAVAFAQLPGLCLFVRLRCVFVLCPLPLPSTSPFSLPRNECSGEGAFFLFDCSSLCLLPVFRTCL